MSGARLESALVPDRRQIAAVLAVLALGIAPGAALAQSGGAGDDQYVDPIGGNSQQQNSGGSNPSGGSSNGPALSNTPALSAQATPAAPAPAASSGQTLPRTGMDAGAVAAIGLALLLAGAALRVRLRHASRL
jgi:LPXTG-motif cell wall-anchored protein